MNIVDCLVIGSGPGGAVTALELKKANKDVILLEAGSHYSLDSCQPYSTSEMEQKYKFGGLTPTFGKPKISYAEGSCVGGGSEVNSGFYHRTPDKILSLWAKKYKILNFTKKELKPYFEAIEKEISVSLVPDKSMIAKASIKLKEGADKLGWDNMEVPRWFKFNDKNKGTKQSMTETHVKWYIENGGVLKDNSLVIKIKSKSNYWVVYYKDLKNNQKKKIKAKSVFLCGGAVSTPFLLRKSGIKRNIGNTLQMHPTIKVIAEFDEIINYTNMGVPVHQVKEFSPNISFGCSISSKPFLALAMLDNEKYIDKVEKNWEKMGIYYGAIIPSGYGKIRKLPYFNDPLVTYSLNDDDLILLSEALKKMCLMLFKAGAKNIYPSIKDYGVINKEKELEFLPKILDRSKTGLMTIHLFSSCPMGEDEKICAVDSHGKIFGHKNLYVNDGSLLPSAPGVNPQGTIMAIARRNIHHFLGLI